MTRGNDICQTNFDELQKEVRENAGGKLTAERRPQIGSVGRMESHHSKKSRRQKLRAQAVHDWNAETRACEKKSLFTTKSSRTSNDKRRTTGGSTSVAAQKRLPLPRQQTRPLWPASAAERRDIEPTYAPNETEILQRCCSFTDSYEYIRLNICNAGACIPIYTNVCNVSVLLCLDCLCCVSKLYVCIVDFAPDKVLVKELYYYYN